MARVRLRWNSSNDAQHQADEAWYKLRTAAKKRRETPKPKRTKKPFTRPDYYTYIKSAKWWRKRNKALAIHGNKCSICGSTDNLHVHHKHYRTLGRENPRTDLQPLCGGCHANHHGKDSDPLTLEFRSIVAAS